MAYKEVIKRIRAAIGRGVELRVKTSGIPCTNPTCTLDPTTNQSTNPFCVICGGFYWINTISGVLVSGHVRWRGLESPRIFPGGTVPEGDCTVTVEFTDQNQDYIERSKNVIVDNKILTLSKYVLKGVPQPNRIQIVLIQETNE